MEKVAAVQFSPQTGYYLAAISVTAQTATADAAIYCTQNGQVATESSTLYTGPLSISRSTILKCRAFKTGMTASDPAEALYVIEGSPPGPEFPKFNTAQITLKFTVDGQDEIRIQNGVMDLIHVNGTQPGNPRVEISRWDGSSAVIDPWSLAPFHPESGFTCNWGSGSCVSTSANLGITDFAEDGVAFVVPGSLNRVVGRGNVSVNSRNRVVINDYQSDYSGYWIIFEYRYTTSEQ
jgi:hypothetical protein